RLVVRRVDQHHVRDVDRTLGLDDAADLPAALDVAQGARPLVTLLHVGALDPHAVAERIGAKHRADVAGALAGGDFDAIALADPEAGHQSTSGASDTIFMKLRSRSSRATGPKMRVPRGFKSLSMITIALLSKRNSEPSSRWIGCLVRTSTARTTSPFLTVPVALASFTFAVI